MNVRLVSNGDVISSGTVRTVEDIKLYEMLWTAALSLRA